MYKSIRVQRFRCFRDLALSDLAQVNLISGRNNVGKTTLLEALYLHCGATNPELALRLARFRGMEVGYTFPPSGQAPWDTLFYRLDRSRPIEISGVDLNGNSRSLKLMVLRDGSMSGKRAEDQVGGHGGGDFAGREYRNPRMGA